MEILDDHIKNMNADEMDLAAESDEGLNYQEDFIRSGFALSDDGDYGDYRIRYQSGDDTVTYDSRGDHATTSMREPEDLEDLKTASEGLVDRLDELAKEWREKWDNWSP